MISALTQSGGGWLPEIHPSAPVPRAIAAAPDGTRILLDGESQQSLIGMPITAPVVIALGPEGGLDAKEKEGMLEGGFKPASLVGATLRFETAGIAGLALVRAMLGQQSRGKSADGH
jgi:16S rRNA (uracil1498-N3)-methyltransferase